MENRRPEGAAWFRRVSQDSIQTSAVVRPQECPASPLRSDADAAAAAHSDSAVGTRDESEKRVVAACDMRPCPCPLPACLSSSRHITYAFLVSNGKVLRRHTGVLYVMFRY